jgi:hypothetical protein
MQNRNYNAQGTSHLASENTRVSREDVLLEIRKLDSSFALFFAAQRHRQQQQQFSGKDICI